MLIMWDEDDIFRGRRLKDSYNALYIIALNFDVGGIKFNLVSMEGRIYPSMTKKEMIDKLNQENFLPYKF